MSTETFAIDVSAEQILRLLSEQPLGVAVTSAYIGRSLGIDGRSVQKLMAPYLLTGVVQRHYDGPSANFGTQWWSLPPNSKRSRPVEKGHGLSPQEPAPSRWTAVMSQVGERVQAPQVVTRSSGAGLRLALWSDGQLVVQRGAESVLYSLEETRVMARYLARMEGGAPVEPGDAQRPRDTDGYAASRDAQQIDVEVNALRLARGRVARYTTFHDDNHAAIDAQIKVLCERMSLGAVQAAWGDDAAETFEQHVLDAAIEAAEWIGAAADAGSDSLSARWA